MRPVVAYPLPACVSYTAAIPDCVLPLQTPLVTSCKQDGSFYPTANASGCFHAPTKGDIIQCLQGQKQTDQHRRVTLTVPGSVKCCDRELLAFNVHACDRSLSIGHRTFQVTPLLA